MSNLNKQMKTTINEAVKEALWENKNVRKVVLESRLAVVEETLQLDEAGFLDRARNFFSKLGKVDAAATVDNPKKALALVKGSISKAETALSGFKADTLRSSSNINNTVDAVLDALGKFTNLLDSIPEEQRGLLERDLMKVVSAFYLALVEERRRIKAYLNGLSMAAKEQGYDLNRSSSAMSQYSKEKLPKVIGSRVVEPDSTEIPAGALV